MTQKNTLKQDDPAYPLVWELIGIFNAQKILGWSNIEFAQRAGYSDDTILERTRRETKEMFFCAPLPPPFWDTILAFAWALCDGHPTPAFLQWLLNLERYHMQARRARPRVIGQTGRLRAITKQMRAEGSISKEPLEPLEMSPALKGALHLLATK